MLLRNLDCDLSGCLAVTQVQKENAYFKNTSIRSNTNNLLLQKRLKAVAIVLLIMLSIFLLESLFDEQPFLLFHIVTFLVIASFVEPLSQNKALPMNQLRVLERIMFGSIIVLFSVKYFYLILQAAQNGNRTTVVISIHHMVSVFFALSILYGLFIPNRWQRTALIVTPLALLPIIIILALRNLHPDVRDIAPSVMDWKYLVKSGFYLGLGLFSAVYGSSIINLLQREVFKSKKIGKYRLIEKIGVGGMGEVWRAQHNLLARPAAIKLIRKTTIFASPSELAVEEFEREAQAIAMLDSLNTIEIYDFGIAQDGSFYYVMELLDGMNLDVLIERYGSISCERAIYLMKQICESLIEAHSMGLIHRDIKPANIFVCRKALRYEFVKVLDFGLVKHNRLSSKEDQRDRDFPPGTPAFMSPEVAKGNPADARADIYGLGCVAYWLVTGELLFPSYSIDEMIESHISKDPITLSERTEKYIIPEFEEIVMRCLQKDPDKRPQTTEELLELLNSCPLQQPWDHSQAKEWWQQKYYKKNHGGHLQSVIQ